MDPKNMAILSMMGQPSQGITLDMVEMSKRNNPKYNTVLTPSEEDSFQKWYSQVSKYKGLSPNPDSEGQYYDYRGYWKNEDRNGMLGADPYAHFIDKYKKPGHPTFSTESQYSSESTPGGNWSQDEYGTWYFNHSPYTAQDLSKTQQYLRGSNEFSIDPKTGEVLTDMHRDILPPVGPVIEENTELLDSEIKAKIALQDALSRKNKK